VVSAVVSVGCFCFFTLAVNGSFLISSMTALGTLPKSATVGWSEPQIMNLDFSKQGIRSRQQPLRLGLETALQSAYSRPIDRLPANERTPLLLYRSTPSISGTGCGAGVTPLHKI
jgi:hypothetical protein